MRGAREATTAPAAQHPLGALSNLQHLVPPSETRSPGLPVPERAHGLASLRTRAAGALPSRRIPSRLPELPVRDFHFTDGGAEALRGRLAPGIGSILSRLWGPFLPHLAQPSPLVA